MKNWSLIIISLFFCLLKAQGQDCDYGHYIDTSNVGTIDYMTFDTSLLSENYFVILLEIDNGSLKSYKFENSADSIIITKLMDKGFQKKKVKGNIKEIQVQPSKLYYASGDRNTHHFNMLILSDGKVFFQIIPLGSNIESILQCLNKYDDLLYSLVIEILDLKRYTD